MPRKINHHRRKFLQVSGGTVLAATLGGWARRARAELAPSSIRLAHLTDTMFTAGDLPLALGKARSAVLFHQAYALADDLMARFAAWPEGIGLVLHSGNLIQAGDLISGRHPAQAAAEWLRRSSLFIRLTLGDADLGPGLKRSDIFRRFAAFGFFEGHGYYSYELGGFHFVHLDAADSMSDSPSRLHERRRQLAWLRADLEEHPSLPTILVLHPPLLNLASHSVPGLAEPDRRNLVALIQSHPQVLLTLSGKTLGNLAGFLPDSSTLCLGTASPVVYPCGGRVIELAVSKDQSVVIRSEFVQTRRLELVEESFSQSDHDAALVRLGNREYRSLKARPGSRTLERNSFALNPGLAPWWSGAESLTLAVVTDVHLCLDQFLSEQDAKDNELIGHYSEKGSEALFTDVLDQIRQGRHRVEFFDETFASNEEAEGNYLSLPVDALLLTGDLAEHGRRAEMEEVLARIGRLPAALRERTLLTVGNHDLFRGEFAEDGSASSRQPIADFYRSYGCADGRAYYAQPLSEWLTLIVLDSTIPTFNGMGLMQEQMDWLADQLEGLREQAVVVASHHPIWPITLVPPLMEAYLRHRSHFTPPLSAARTQLQKLFARFHSVKLAISGHYHGVCVDQYRKAKPAGVEADDPFTTHVQVPCTVEYPCGYTLFKVSRGAGQGRIEYVTAYSRLAALRRKSSQALLYEITGTKLKVPRHYEGTLERLSQQDNIFGFWASFNPKNLMEINLRGFKDGTDHAGRGNTGKPNLKGKIEFSL